MNLSRPSPAPTRYVGLGLVAALHLAGLYALSAGLIQPPAKPQTATVLLPHLDDKKPEPARPLEPFKAERPTLKAPDLPVPTPLPWQDLPAPGDTSTRTEAPLGVPGATGPTVAAGPSSPPQAPVATPAIAAAGAVCAVMPRPEVPAVQWSGEAVLQVLATVRGGRVVGSEFRVAQGALDGKSRRALQRAVETALAGYQCQGDAVFQQDFAFRLD